MPLPLNFWKVTKILEKLMDHFFENLPALLNASPLVLTLLLSIAVVGLAAFAIWALHTAYQKKDR